jgi:hypothetical protein
VTNDSEFRAFGRVWPAVNGDAANVERQMIALALREGLEAIEIVRTSREAGAAAAIAEVHPRSPQLTISLNADWLVRVVPPGVGPDGFADQLRVFRVPTRVPIMIKAGIWHVPTQMLGPTDVLTLFRAGTTTGGTDWVELEAPLYGGVGL